MIKHSHSLRPLIGKHCTVIDLTPHGTDQDGADVCALVDRGLMLVLQDIGWFDKDENTSGALAGRLGTDTAHIRGAVGDQAGVLVQNLVTIVAALAIAFSR